MTKSLSNLTEDEIIAALNRSGYLLESGIIKKLADYGFFVQSNVSSLDPTTGKSREIDIFAEFFQSDEESSKNKITARTRFVFEVKNNIYPLVLLTKMAFHPDNEPWDFLKMVSTCPPNVNYSPYTGFYDILIDKEDKDLFTQYCSFQKKKANEDLMALHPDVVYDGLMKITCFCEEILEKWNRNDDDDSEYIEEYLRDFLYLPVLLINDDLYELHIEDDHKPDLKKVECSRLVFNYHYKQEPKSAIVFVVTKKGIDDFLRQVILAEKQVKQNMLKAKNGSA